MTFVTVAEFHAEGNQPATGKRCSGVRDKSHGCFISAGPRCAPTSAQRSNTDAEATQALREEHEIILQVLDVAEQVGKKLSDGIAVDATVLTDILEFLRTFADCSHHGKEEELLFPALERAGLPIDGGPIAVMLMEHTQGRELIREMVTAAEKYRAGGTEAGFQWATASEEYVDLLRSHIFKENTVLFAMAERILLPEQQEQLGIKFKEIENAKVGAEQIKSLRRKANELAISLGIAHTQAFLP